MAKGGHSGGHSHGHSHSFGHNHSFGRSNGIGNRGFGYSNSSFSHHRSSGRHSGPSLETVMDDLHNNQIPPTLINGVYTFGGSQMTFRTYAENPAQPTPINMMMMPMMQMQMMPMMPVPTNQMQMMPGTETTGFPIVPPVAPEASMPAPIQQANITLVGNKTKSSNICCCFMTLMCVCLIFPIFFMCCEWWKKMVCPLYELTAQAYQSIGDFIRVNPTVTNLNLTVIDNAFSAEKARILAAGLSNSRITGITFINGAIALNGSQNELDNFAGNVQPIKSLNLTSSVTWGDVIV